MRKIYFSFLTLFLGAALTAQGQSLQFINFQDQPASGGSECEFGSLTSNAEQSVCPEEAGLYAVDGTIIPTGGGFGISFISMGGTGGAQGLTLLGVQIQFPQMIDAGLGGLLAQNDLEPLEGPWMLLGYVYADEDDVQGSLCAEPDFTDVVTMTFLLEDDEDCTTSSVIESNSDRVSFSMFPNPTNDVVTIAYDAPFGEMLEVMIVSTRGDIVYRANEFVTGQMNRVIDVSDLAAGMYLVRASSQSGSTVEKLLIGNR